MLKLTANQTNKDILVNPQHISAVLPWDGPTKLVLMSGDSIMINESVKRVEHLLQPELKTPPVVEVSTDKLHNIEAFMERMEDIINGKSKAL